MLVSPPPSRLVGEELGELSDGKVGSVGSGPYPFKLDGIVGNGGYPLPPDGVVVDD